MPRQLSPRHPHLGAIQRVRALEGPRPNSTQPLRVLVAFVGLWRHFRLGYVAFDRKFIAPNEAAGATVKIALYTDPHTFCSTKESIEGHCGSCIERPMDVQATAREVYGSRLLRVRLGNHSDFKSRLADAWHHSLRHFSQNHDVTLVMRSDVNLTHPLLLRSACAHTFDRTAPAFSDSSPRVFGYLACSPTAAVPMLSDDDAEDEGAVAVRRDTLNAEGLYLDRMHCPDEPDAMEVHDDGLPRHQPIVSVHTPKPRLSHGPRMYVG